MKTILKWHFCLAIALLLAFAYIADFPRRESLYTALAIFVIGAIIELICKRVGWEPSYSAHNLFAWKDDYPQNVGAVIKETIKYSLYAFLCSTCFYYFLSDGSDWGGIIIVALAASVIVTPLGALQRYSRRRRKMIGERPQP